eukprot:TRINITY_DN32101_c0_g1_i1.p1 TRINITY_DN32101_c0_g1~~TRINITY_DN32101_c0_g1_i1.p1  ORF type:complete len:396 (-),score=122.56 TRINITY_DN32101_c0_g1_i1:111-1298(-)
MAVPVHCDADFESFLQQLHAATTKNLEVIPKTTAETGPDPFFEGLRRQDEEARQRKAAHSLRWTELDKELSKKENEAQWRKQIAQKKEEERLMKEAAAAAAAAAEEAAREAEQALRWKATPKCVFQPDSSAKEARIAQEEQWLEEEWAPRLALRQQEARQKRLEENRLQQEAWEAEVARLNREQAAMAREDQDSTAFVSCAEAERQRLEQEAKTPRGKRLMDKAAEAVLERRGAEIRWQQNLQQRRMKEAEELRRREEQQKEHDYRQWRERIRQDRCKQQRLQERLKELDAEKVAEHRRLELQGRDPVREMEVKTQAALENAVREAQAESRRMQERGVSPRRALDEALRLAELQRKKKQEQEPVRAEQELWDALLAKNRLARKQAKSPRWGAFSM